MNIGETIKGIEQFAHLGDDKPVSVYLNFGGNGPGEKIEIEGIVAAENDSGVYIVAKHTCPEPKPGETVYLWNGKRIDDMSREELAEALIGYFSTMPKSAETVKPVSAKAPSEAKN